MKRFLLFIVCFLMPLATFAQDVTNYRCALDELTRRVEILSEPGVRVPCEVHYYKDTEAPGERQVLWSASSEDGYCERKTEEFVAKLQGWGWSCSSGATPAAPESAPVPEAAPAPEAAPEPDAAPEAAPEPVDSDETDDLIPAEASVSQA